MSLKERFMLEDLECENMRLKRIFPTKEEDISLIDLKNNHEITEEEVIITNK